MRLPSSGRVSIVAGWALCGLLAGCGTVTIHDEGRAKLASDGRQAYAAAKVTEAPEIEARNLDYLLGEEVKTVKDNVALQVEFAALAIANDTGPMAGSVEAALQRLNALGFAGPQEVRRFLVARAVAADRRATAATEAGVLSKLGVAVPDCEAVATSPDRASPRSRQSKQSAADTPVHDSLDCPAGPRQTK